MLSDRGAFWQAFPQIRGGAARLKINLYLRTAPQLACQLIDRPTFQSVLRNQQFTLYGLVRAGDDQILKRFPIGDAKKQLRPTALPTNIGGHEIFRRHSQASKFFSPEGIRSRLGPRSA